MRTFELRRYTLRSKEALDIPIIKYLNAKRVILASASPRRKALLQQVRDPSLVPSISSCCCCCCYYYCYCCYYCCCCYRRRRCRR